MSDKVSANKNATKRRHWVVAMAAGILVQNDLLCCTAANNMRQAAVSSGSGRRPTSKYTKVGERLRHVIPGHMQCSMTCGGRACKYENPTRWSDEEQAIKGLYSSWITDNILAMARPSTEIIEKYNIIKQFQSCGIKTVINLQRPGEHASCGNPLEQESGFTYIPEAFMEAEIYFYNFGWKDYGVASLTTILDMVKVMSFALQEGKVAVHCHAGLGRTGVLIACYLIFATRMTADQAILFVRAKRHNAIQTRVQLLCVREFTQFLIPLHNVFSCCNPKAHAVTLSQYLIRQQHLLHGYEARHLKYVPKIIHLVCKLLIDLVENRLVVEEQILDVPDLSAEIEKTVAQLPTEQLDKVLGSDIGTVDALTHSVTTAACYGVQDSVLSSEQEFDPLWKRRNVECLQPLSHLKKRLSYSDSDLRKAEILLEQGETPWTEPSQMTFLNKLNEHLRLKHCFASGNHDEAHPLPTPNLKKEPFVPTAFSFWSQSKMGSIDAPRENSPLFHRRKFPREMHRSRTFSLGFSSPLCGQTSDLEFSAPNITSQDTPDCSYVTKSSNVLENEEDDDDDDIEATSPKATFYLGSNDTTEVIPQIVLQSELNLEARSLLAAKALANLDCDDAEEIAEKVFTWQMAEVIPQIVLQSELNLEARSLLAIKALANLDCVDAEKIAEKVFTWKKELNSRESAWDRICAERNPFVLSNLMWSWIEQLKEPVITKESVQLLASYGSDPENALYLLEKGQHQTILCILQCVSNLQPLPTDIEDAILTRMITAFTMISQDSENSSLVYNTLKPIFKHALTDIRK